MIIRCWGARGSIPVSGKDFIRYGGDTACMEIRSENDEVLIIDAGSGIRNLGQRLITEEKHSAALLMTHFHWDHILGFPFFKPLYHESYHLENHGSLAVRRTIMEIINGIMAPPFFPVHIEDIRAQIHYREWEEESFSVYSFIVEPIALSHPNRGNGYKITENGKKFVFLTDNELGYRHENGWRYEDYREFSRNADLLVHDAEYTEDDYQKTKGWGHSTYKDALQLALDAGVRRLWLFHHHQERSDDDIDRMVLECREIIKSRNASLECFAMYQGMEITL
ncbi:MAG: MBL fold metallo-hydrolase [Syntrophobacterales bacterium]|jgi:phosphoribosyl 1,2-cyclic phosphodiesterase|nr:MBL fold metallo-hydrolase [Syntrophobacterales bacterium]